MSVERANRVGVEDRGPWQASSGASVRAGARRSLPATVRTLLLLLVVAAAIAGSTLWWRHEHTSAPTYLTAAVTRGAVIRTVVATGTVNPQLTIIVGSYVSGVIRDMYCDYNTRVKKGQLCAKIDPRPYQAALDQAQGQLARDSAQLAGARHDLERYAVLWGQNSVSKQTYDDQDALVKELEGTVQLDRAAVETAQVNLGYTNIISPVDGTVVARNITIGQTVAASFQTPTLFLIATDLTKMQVDTNVSESDIGAVREGDAARFTVEAFTDRSFQGTVAQVRQAPQTVQNVVTYDVVVDVDNSQFLLKPGMTATVQIVSAQRTDVLRVPDQALRFIPGGLRGGVPGASLSNAAKPQVWVLRAGKPAAVALRTGLDDDSYTEVTGGDLQAGDQVIIGE
jgi:HlyD family secretion protein